MPIYNSEVADKFEKVADLLDIRGANQFRIRAYRNAARKINNLSRNLYEMVKNKDDLTQMQGIGKDLAGKIKEIVETGKLEQLQELEQELPSGLPDLLNIPGLGPERVKDLYQKLGIETKEDLKKAVQQGKVRELDGFGEKTEKNILKALSKKSQKERTKLVLAEELIQPLVSYLKSSNLINKVAVAGSYRRKKETIGDIDILVTGRKGKEIVEYFTNYEDVEDVDSKGETKSTVILRTGMQIDLRVVEDKSYGAALLYFTGSKEHNIRLRNLAIEKGLKINEYGVFKKEKQVAGETEKEIYNLLNMPYIEPEIREARGEIAAAQKRELPALIERGDLKGDLQMHTTDSDGGNSLKEMAEASAEQGYKYIAITDHSAYMGITQGLDEKGLAEQLKRLEKINSELENIEILKSMEVDILEDGSLDLPESSLKKLDLVTCSIHTKFNLSPEKQTERILKAMDNPYFNIFAHPTGRIINAREAYQYDVEKVMKKAKEKGIAMEINAHPARLDLNDIYAKMAKEIGVPITISTDAHSTEELKFMKYGVNQARRGWLEPANVLNTYPLEKLKDFFGKK